MDTSSSIIQPIQTIDFRSALALSKTNDVLDSFFLELCGLQVSKKGDNIVMYRISKPLFTYEAANELVRMIHVEVNRITGRTTYGDRFLNNYFTIETDGLIDYLARVAFHQMVSFKAWTKIQEMNNTDKEGRTLWETEVGITWDINDPVTNEMLSYIKDKYDLEFESWGQDSVLRRLFHTVSVFITGGMNRSLNKLTLDHEKAIHKETTILDSPVKQHNEGILQSIKQGLGRMVSPGERR